MLLRIDKLLPALVLAVGAARATPRAEAEAEAAAHAIAEEAGRSNDAMAMPQFWANSSSGSSSSGGRNSSIGSYNETSVAPIMVPINYTITVFNSDCPCRRTHLRYCTWFRRQRVRDGRCYPISHYAQSTRVLDPLVSERNRLACRIYTGLHCDGLGFELTFVDSTRCREPAHFASKQNIGYRSFVCYHVGA
ncbi:hypothetical protein HRG_001064 [Hirsutella rhossiliensis]|uniref:Uncharacterized protein n=1 Tax=Hirsutella rhossiliensis TaxID=111463 RepID=A0A9P8N8D2_9HYPO|nr:uncharacterized protein HRG_01064 [Hirsutella rhossiliensis]KAH0968422.1 hypothetical protein HRG_01064 [Hirsutella rhossiliensis]